MCTLVNKRPAKEKRKGGKRERDIVNVIKLEPTLNKKKPYRFRMLWFKNEEINKRSTPDVVKMVINYFGGLNSDQLLFTSNPEKDGLFLCAWWPWGNGETISIRLAVFSELLTDQENEELTTVFKSWFKI